MMQTNWETGVYADTEVTEIDWVTGSIHSSVAGVDSRHLIISCNELHTLSFPS